MNSIKGIGLSIAALLLTVSCSKGYKAGLIGQNGNSSLVSADSLPGDPTKIIMFTDINFSGSHLELSGSERDLRNLGINDLISSMHIPEGMAVRLWTDINFEGFFVELTTDTADLRKLGEFNFNDTISSIEIVNGGNNLATLCALFKDQNAPATQTLNLASSDLCIQAAQQLALKECSGRSTSTIHWEFRGASLVGDVIAQCPSAPVPPVPPTTPTAPTVPTVPTAPAAPVAPTRITLYGDLNFGGSAFEIPGVSIEDLRTFGFNDIATSIRIPAGMTVRLWSDINFQGSFREINSDVSDFRTLAIPGGDMNDKVSSVEIVTAGSPAPGTPAAPSAPQVPTVPTAPTVPDVPSSPAVPVAPAAPSRITLYHDLNFGGSSFEVPGVSIEDLRDFGFNDTATSIQVPAGMTVRLWTNINFEGSFREISSDVTDFRTLSIPGGDLNDQVSSVEIVSAGSPARAPSAGTPSAPAPSTRTITRLYSEQYLAPEESMYSDNGDFQLKYQSDGNLVVYYARAGNALSSSSTTNAGQAKMQSDGNFVIYDGSGRPVFYSCTDAPENSGSYLMVSVDSTVNVVRPDGVILWNSLYGNLMAGRESCPHKMR